MSVRKPILDACCGGKMFYFDKNDPRVLFQDIREVKTTPIHRPILWCRWNIHRHKFRTT